MVDGDTEGLGGSADIANEEWRPIPGATCYSVSNLGRIRSDGRMVLNRGSGGSYWATGRVLTPVLNKGYPFVNLAFGDAATRKCVPVHRMVMLAFVGPCPVGMEVRHMDGTRDNPRLDNLLYGTRAENIADAKRHGTFPLLEKRPGARLTRNIAKAIAESDDLAHVLAARYGVSTAAIQGVRNGRTWRSVTDGIRRESYMVHGEGTFLGRLTEPDVREILSSYDSDYVLAKRYGTSSGPIRKIRENKAWKHIDRSEFVCPDPRALYGPKPMIRRGPYRRSVTQPDLDNS